MTAREIELKELMVRSLDGDAGAYQLLLRQLLPQLRAFFRRRLNGDDVAEDLVQETLIAVHDKRATYERTRPFSAWLYAIARYKLADHFRRHHRRPAAAPIDEDIAAPEFESATLAMIDVNRMLGELPPKQGNAIRATKLDGYSVAEASAAAGISESDTKMSVFRGLKRLSARVQGKSQ